MHVKSRKMVQMNLVPGQEPKFRCRQQMHGHGQGVREREVNWEIRFDINVLPCVRQIASGKLLQSKGAQLSALR